MSALAVARKDLRKARRSRTLWAVASLLAILSGLVVYAAYVGSGEQRVAVARAYRTLGLLAAVIVPIVTLLATYLAIAGERDSGGIKFLLSLPNSRRDVFLGKFASRLVVACAGVTFMFVVAAVVTVSKFDVFPAGVVLGAFAATLAYAAAFVSVGVATSSVFGSRRNAIGGAIAAYFGVVILYVIPVVSVQSLVRWVHTELLGMEPNVDLYSLVRFTSPFVAYQKGLNVFFPDDADFGVFREALRQRATDGDVQAVDLPLYLSDEFALVVFALWLVVPLVAGYWRFRRADLQ